MIDINQFVKVKWMPQTRKWYETQGFVFTNYGDEFLVKIPNLPKGSNAFIEAICDFCGKPNKIKYRAYNKSKNVKFGDYKCLDCYVKRISEFSAETRRDDIYNRVTKTCEKYGYILLTDKSDIKDVNTRIRYKCPKHGEKERRAHLFMYGDHSCPECNNESKHLTVDEVIKRVADRGTIILNPNDFTGTQDANLNIICCECGEGFLTSLNSFLCTRDGAPQRCPECAKKKSAGENAISQFLIRHDIPYTYQKTFDNCKDERRLPFDFYLIEHNMVIEFDGMQHYVATTFGHCDDATAEEKLTYTQRHDKIKDEFCNANGIKIIRIPYYDYKNIDKILMEKLL